MNILIIKDLNYTYQLLLFVGVLKFTKKTPRILELEGPINLM